MKQREHIINNYIAAYNSFDADRMVADFDDNIRFENISNGKVDMTLVGVEAFRQQAEQAKRLLSERKQTILSFVHEADKTTIEIDYFAILAIDLPNGLKKGAELKLSGVSVFKFEGNKIIALSDIS
ncbi:nuclear transport factor 2 family protein [Chitinophaga sp. RAB17]|uniref:nuclear transport factor 2 family protein n=1 Tax=Chitinophaga sp. RAB17 TaxID=3233049 RepID=UPI003F90A3AA